MFNLENVGLPETLTDAELMQKLEDEHLRLQRQVRMIQTDRLNRTQDVHPMFRQKDNLLRALKMEYMDLKKDLKIARSGAQKKRDQKMKSNLKKSILLQESTQLQCDGGLSIMEEFDGLLDTGTKEMIHLRKRMMAVQGALDNRRFQSEKRLVSSKNQLEVEMHRFNVLQCENRRIREEIEHMLKDRALFKQAWDKMLTALGTGKKFLSDLFESSTLAYDQRDEWCAKLRSIQEKGKMDQMLQIQEMRDLKKAYDHEMTVYKFLAKKGIRRINRREEERQEERKMAEEEEARKEYDYHSRILDDIYEYTDESCTDKIIKDFNNTEQENFATYKLLNEYCAENVVLEKNLQAIRRDIEDRSDFNEQAEVRRQDKLEEMRRNLDKQSQRTQHLRSQLDQKNKLLTGVVSKVNDMFKMVDCTLEPFQNLLGDKQPTMYTLEMSLKLITVKVKEHIENVYYCEHKLKERVTTSRLKRYTVYAECPDSFTAAPIDYLVPADPCPSCIETRWMSRVCEALEQPLTRGDVSAALAELEADPAYVRSDRVHALADCRATASRKLLATRHTY